MAEHVMSIGSNIDTILVDDTVEDFFNVDTASDDDVFIGSGGIGGFALINIVSGGSLCSPIPPWVDNELTRWDGASPGGNIQGSNIFVDDSQNLTGLNNVTMGGNLAVNGGGITSSTGAISFADENLSTTGTLASGALTVTGTALVTSTLTVNSDTDGTTILGRTKIGSIGTNTMYLSHFSHFSATNFALAQFVTGGVILNAALGQNLVLSINNVVEILISASNISIPNLDVLITMGDLQVIAGDVKINNGSLGVGRAPTVAGDFFSASNISVIIETTNANGFASLDLINDAQQWRMGVRNDDTWSVRDVTGAKQVLQINTSGDVEVPVGDIIATIGDIIAEAGFLILPKASTAGIKVDTAAPTFGFADIIGDQFSKNTGATKPVLTAYNGDVFGWQFGVGDEAFMSFHIPHDYVKGTDIFLHIHWSHTGLLVTSGTVTFKVTSIYAKGHNQAAFTSAPAVGTFVGTASTTQYQHILTEVQYSDSTPTGIQVDTDLLEPDGIIEMTFEVDANDITVSSGGVPDPFIHFVDIHYQTTGLIGTKDKVPDFYT